jgi:hypothetical protein
VFGVHCVGGILGAILTGVFNNPELGGTGIYDYVAGTWGYAGTFTQVKSQLWGVGVTLLWSGTVSFICYKIVDLVIGLRASGRGTRPKAWTPSARRARLRLSPPRLLSRRAPPGALFFLVTSALNVNQCSFHGLCRECLHNDGTGFLLNSPRLEACCLRPIAKPLDVMEKVMLRTLFLLTAATAVLASGPVAADVYKFKDDKGSVLYTDKPATLPAGLNIQSRRRTPSRASRKT